MPSPVGHILAGAGVYLSAVRKQDRSRPILAVTLLGSIVPDFDFMPGFFIGKLSAYHHGMSHSLTFAVFFAAAVFILAENTQKKIAVRAAILGGLGYPFTRHSRFSRRQRRHAGRTDLLALSDHHSASILAAGFLLF